MAQQTTADDSTDVENDPELVAATWDEAVESLKVHMTRDEMRETCRAWDLEGYSGTKHEMARTMMTQAEPQSLGLLAEEGVDLRGDLAPEGAEDEAEAEDSEDDSSGRQRASVGEMLRQHPQDYHRDNALAFSQKQVEVLAWAMNHAGDTDEQVAESVDCSARYVNSVCHRWPASDEGIQALEDAGHDVPECYQETDAPEGGA